MLRYSLFSDSYLQHKSSRSDGRTLPEYEKLRIEEASLPISRGQHSKTWWETGWNK